MVRQVKMERIKRGIRSYEMAALVGYNPQLWARVENGLREPPPEVAQRASTVLGLPRSELFCSAE